jgi:hypothetical protein
LKSSTEPNKNNLKSIHPKRHNNLGNRQPALEAIKPNQASTYAIDKGRKEYFMEGKET